MTKLRKFLERAKSAFRLHYLLSTAAASVLAVILAFAVVAWKTQENPIAMKVDRERANTANRIVNDVTEINPVRVVDIVVPHSLADIVAAVIKYDYVSIGGGRNSMGGQTASERAVQLDMREYNKILELSKASKEVTVQAGARWRDIQDAIDPHDLSVKIMQTYANFTVGGSLSVNVHGRYMGLGPIILSVKKFTIVLADGSVVEASPTEHSDIFYSAIGGLGGIGVISDVTLELADNVNVERSRVKLPTEDYAAYFRKYIRPNPDVIFHNGDMYPPGFDQVSAVSWTKTDKAPTTGGRLIPRRKDYWLERIAWAIMSDWPGGRWIREYIIDALIYLGDAPVHTRNYEASYDIAELEPESRDTSTYVLQEYFVPIEWFDEWVPKMKKVFNDNDVNVLNVSIRHVRPDPGAKLAWARTETFAFVVYYKQGTDEESKESVSRWTRQMIEEVLSVGGSYYLPYQPLATDEEFHRAYPGAVKYFAIKKAYDPADKFTNKLWERYYSGEKLQRFAKRREVFVVASTTKEYVRPFDNTYLSIPEWYIVYSADEYAAVLRDGLPSEFPYFTAIKDYWREHKAVLWLTASSANDNEDYKSVLSVIGWSFSAENAVKGVYENSIGKFFEWVSGNTQVVEDHYATKVAQDYATFLYDYPWYDFPYFSYLKGVWTLESDREYTWREDIRRYERKLFLSIEYGIKSLYSSAIAFATHAKFGVQDDIISAVVTRNGGKTYELIHAPHYQPFTRLLLGELERESANTKFRLADIAGNEKITLTYRATSGAGTMANAKEIMRDPEITAIVGGKKQYANRITVEADVSKIPAIYRALRAHGVAIDHFYDY